MADQVTRSAARLAALIALPVALLAGLGAFVVLRDAFEASAQPPPATTGTPTSVPTAPVEMPAPELSGWPETVCRALLSQLPAALDGAPQRAVSAGPEQNAAYGEPPITVACGVEPADYEPTDQVYSHDGVCWHAEERTEASVWTTLDREVPVRVTVPAGYDGPYQRVAALDRTILETVRSTDSAPSGC